VALISLTARQRLARVLVCLAETIGAKSSDGFEFDATNEELAGAANVHSVYSKPALERVARQ